MPLYKDLSFFKENRHKNFDGPFLKPGTLVERDAGIYRCKNCGFEVAVKYRDLFPVENQCKDHCGKWTPPASVAFGPVQWQLVALVNEHPDHPQPQTPSEKKRKNS